MKKNAFTLAEILIVLGIIGVVSALTIPSLMSNVGAQKIGPQLSTFSSNLQNGLQNYMTDNELDTLTIADLRQAVTTNIDASFYNTDIYTLANGQAIRISNPAAPTGTIATAPAYVSSKIADVRLLINSKTATPNFDTSSGNKLAYELFDFSVDASGNVIPWGSKLENTSYGTTRNCVDNSTTTDLSGCPGAIMDNGWSTKGIVYYD